MRHWTTWIFAAVLANFGFHNAVAQPFVESPSAGLVGVQLSAGSWADYDQDGDLDLLLAGRDNSLSATTRLYRNDGSGTFTVVGTGFVSVEFGAAAWGDYDNDDDLDLVIIGQDDLETPVARLYRNDGATFTSVAAGLTGVENGGVAWGDYDNDGDLDLALCGRQSSTLPLLRIYRNTAGVFQDAGAGLPGLENSSVAWGDFDLDRDLDLLVSGLDQSMNRITRIYRNDNGSFVDQNADLAGVERGTAMWCDYDGDGDLDIAVAGSSNTGIITRLYRNDAGPVFLDAAAGLPGVQSASMDWGDCDNDGDADLLLTGIDNALARLAIVFRNDAGTFVNASAGLTPVRSGTARWGDCDGDRDLDLVLCGQDALGQPVAKLYRNDVATPNTVPAPPGTPSVTLVGTTAVISWAAGSDAESNSKALSYNLRVGTTPGGSEVLSAMADGSTGRRRLVDRGVTSSLSWFVRLPTLGRYYFAVQTIDPGYGASPFTAEQSFATAFTDFSSSLTGMARAALQWGDYDNDNDLDVLMTGTTAGGASTRLYRNDGGTFVQTGSGLDVLDQGAAAWGDFDRDGDLDVALSGYSPSLGRTTRIYRNNGAGSFSDIGAGIEGAYLSALAWGDYDNDGDLDLLMSGNSNCCGRIGRLYRNNGGGTFQYQISFEGFENGTVSWVDLDKDGDLDIFFTGLSNCCSRHSRWYRNNGAGAFDDMGSPIEGVTTSSVDWGDFDGNGYPDLLLTGYSQSGVRTSRIYRNNGNGSFSDAGAGLVGIDQGMARWADSDSDGDLDVVISGQSDAGPVTRVYRNEFGVFSDTVAGLQAVAQSAVAWGDFDGDRDADLLVTGLDQGSAYVAKLYRNNATLANAAPGSPGIPAVQLAGLTATFSWSGATDDRTPTNQLTYHLRVGTTPGGGEIIPAMADVATGFRRLVGAGNAGQRLAWTVRLPQLGTYYWSVQAVDASYTGSAFLPEQIYSTPFSDMNAGLAGVNNCALAWGDYDADGDLDLLVTGNSSSFGRMTALYRNDAGTFVNTGAALDAVFRGSAAWGDYDRDGDLDIFLSGNSYSGPIAKVYRNDSGSFTDIGAGLVGVQYSSGDWGDYDNDGDIDILMTGLADCCGATTRLYRNNGNGTFTNIGVSIVGTYYGTVSWGDYDNDGDLDVLLTGYGHYTRVYRNDGNATFTDIGANVSAVYQSCAVWGDYDNDGDLDILLTGAGPITRIYRNNAGTFSDINANIEGIYDGTCAWGDYDNDGDLDVAITGYSNNYGPITRVYRNNNGSFADADLSLDGMATGSALVWGDFDDDGDLDLVCAGQNTQGQVVTRLYRNNVATGPNSAPAAPANLHVNVVGTRASLTWDAPIDATTPAAGLSYNLRIGTTPGGSQILAPMANSTTGRRRIAARGPGSGGRAWSLDLSGIPVTSTLYFAVQAIDHGFAGSPFSSEAVFSGTPTIQSVTDVGNDQGRQVRIRWSRSVYDSPGASTQVTNYSIWRLVGPYKTRDRKAAGAGGGLQPPRMSMPAGEWDYLLSVPARANNTYSVVAPTLCDSTPTAPCVSTFFVSAMTANPGIYFDSEPRGGCSVDNLAPAAPQGFVASLPGPGQVLLQWAPVEAVDFNYYAVYRGTAPGFPRNAATRIGYATEPVFQDVPGAGASTYYYKVSAVDFSENEGAASAEVTVTTQQPSDAPPHVARFALGRNYPNPFNPSTRIEFEIASPCHVRLEVFSLEGRWVRSLVDLDLAPGVHFAYWDGLDAHGNRVASGPYLYRMTAGAFHKSGKMLLIE